MSKNSNKYTKNLLHIQIYLCGRYRIRTCDTILLVWRFSKPLVSASSPNLPYGVNKQNRTATQRTTISRPTIRLYSPFVAISGLEPLLFWIWIRCFNQLSYIAISRGEYRIRTCVKAFAELHITTLTTRRIYVAPKGFEPLTQRP